MFRIALFLALLGTGLGVAGDLQSGGQSGPTPRASVDPITLLQARIDAGETVPRYDSIQGYVPWVLEELGVSTTSQGLIFSRTSLQTDRIGPWAPRAVYFSDDVYVGYVQYGPIMEVASVHPSEGMFFYTFAQDSTRIPRFEREGTTCLMCHESGITEGVPGLIMRSVLTDRLGYPVTDIHDGATNDRTPIERRWGGWYVTGTHGEPGHSGNVLAPDLDGEISDRRGYLSRIDMHAQGNVTDLSGRFDVNRYPSGHSDIVALMVLTHQVRVHNLMSRVHQEGTRALGGLAAQKGYSLPAVGPGIRSVAAVDRLLDAMLFVGEAELTAPVKGGSGFAEDFAARGPFDAHGRSLRDFDLSDRLFRYPLSFLIYSDAFDALPQFALNELYGRLHAILRGEIVDAEYAHLSGTDRQAILEILTETKPSFAAWIDRASSTGRTERDH